PCATPHCIKSALIAACEGALHSKASHREVLPKSVFCDRGSMILTACDVALAEPAVGRIARDVYLIGWKEAPGRASINAVRLGDQVLRRPYVSVLLGDAEGGGRRWLAVRAPPSDAPLALSVSADRKEVAATLLSAAVPLLDAAIIVDLVPASRVRFLRF